MHELEHIVIQQSTDEWTVRGDRALDAVGTFLTQGLAVSFARDLLVGGGDIRIVRDGADDEVIEISPGGSQQRAKFVLDDLFDAFTMTAPALLCSILGPAAPTFFAPSTLRYEPGPIGLFLAAFTWSLTCAVLAYLMADGKLAPESYLLIIPAALVVANSLSFAFGGGVVDSQTLGASDPVANGPGGLSGHWLGVVFILGGISSYGVGGLVIGMFFGLTAGLNFQRRHDVARASL